MRIAIDIRQLCQKQPSGIGHYAYEVISRLIRNEDIEWILFASGRHASREVVEELLKPGPHVTIQICRTPNKLLMFDIWSGRKTLDNYLACDVDGWFFPNLDFIRTELPYAITAHDISYELFPEFFSLKDRLWHQLIDPRKLYTGAQAVICVSEATRSDIVRAFGVRTDLAKTVPLGLNDSFIGDEQPSDRHCLQRHGLKEPYLLMISTIEPRKNHLGSIKAYELWREMSATEMPLVIAGRNGYQAHKVHHAIKKSKFRDDIKVLGYIPSSDRACLVRHASTLLFPSYYEGFGLPVIEALACDTPVVAGATSSMMEISHPLLLHVNPFNVHDIAEAISHLSEIKAAKLPEIDLRSWNDVAEESLAILEKIPR